MRLFMDVMIALMLAALLAGGFWYTRTDQTIQQGRETARAEVRRFQQQIALQSALAKVQCNERGYPETVDPQWFQGILPANPLLEAGHPWVEIAGPNQKDLIHPPDRIATRKDAARYWYNPHTGTVRARVPAAISDAAAIDLYNYINESNLPELFADGSTGR